MECNDQKVSGYGRNIVYLIFIDFYNLNLVELLDGWAPWVDPAVLQNFSGQNWHMNRLKIDSYEWDKLVLSMCNWRKGRK